MPGLLSGRAVFIIVLVVIVLGAAATFNCGCGYDYCPGPDSGTGILTGTVSIGPLCPVEPCMVSRDQLAAAYAARPITISTPSGSGVATVTADPETGYSVALQPGTYIVTIGDQGIGGSPELPATVTIRSGETFLLNISIDTGIR